MSAPTGDSTDDIRWLWDMHYLVFKGASVTGLCYVGFVQRMRETYRRFGRDMDASFEGYGGSSIGALMALVVSLGVDMDRVRAHVLEHDFSEIVQNMHIGTLHASKGLVDNALLQRWVGNMLERWTGDAGLTFRGHLALTGKRLRVVASDVSHSRGRGDDPVFVFDADSAPDCPIRLAVATSMAIPIIFSPTEYRGKLLVDGGLYNNFPMDLFPLERTVGVRVRSIAPPLTDTVLQYTFQVFASCHEMLEEASLRLVPLERRRQLLTIDVGGVPFYNFQVGDAAKRSLMDDGWQAADARFAPHERRHESLARVPRLVARCFVDLLALSCAIGTRDRPGEVARTRPAILRSSIDSPPRDADPPSRPTSDPIDVPVPPCDEAQ